MLTYLKLNEVKYKEPLDAHLPTCINQVQCNLDLVTLLVSAKTVTKSHNDPESNDFMCKLKNGLCKIVTKSQYSMSLNRDRELVFAIFNCNFKIKGLAKLPYLLEIGPLNRNEAQ
jgi:hypothetical protein